jgi:hypothetical protein
LQKLAIDNGVDWNNQQARQQSQAQMLGFYGALLTAGGMAISDRRAKTDAKRLRDVAADLRKTPGYGYRYKDARHGSGTHVGPMAQDLELTRAFRGAVREVGGIKRVDTGRLALAQHAALGSLQAQIDRLRRAGTRKPRAK